MRSRALLGLFVLFLCIPISLAADEYKPYLHKPTVPDHPEVRLFGQYRTNLFPGAATYTYPIEVPKGTNGLQPSVTVSYNSQAVKQRPGILGAGWVLTSYDYIYRDVNSTPDDVSDDEYYLILDGNQYELVLNPADNKWHTEVEYHFRIENYSGMYWNLTKKDGTKYRFGYNADSRLESNTGRDYSLKWFVDEIMDTHGNRVYHTYSQDPNAEDSGAVYPSKIEYNTDQQRKIEFSYESSVRPDRRMVFDQGNMLEESRRLTDISVFADDSLVRRYHIDYATLNPALTSIDMITYYGSDNASVLNNISFDYYSAEAGSDNTTTDWTLPAWFSSDTADYGVRLVDVNNDGFADIVQGKATGSVKKTWLNDKTSGWEETSDWIVPVNIIDSNGYDQGVRFADVDLDGFTDMIRADTGARSVYINNGSGWDEDAAWSFPSIDIVDASGRDLGVRLADVNGDGKVDVIKAKTTKTVYLNNGSGWNEDSSWTVPEDFVDASYNDRGLRLIDLNADGLVDIIKGNSGTRTAWLNNGTNWSVSATWTPPVDFRTASKADNGVRFADLNSDGLVDLLEDYFNGSESSKGAWLNTGSGWSADSVWQSNESFTKNGKNKGRRLADVDGDGFVDIVVSHSSDKANYTWVKNKTLPFMLKSITNEYGGMTFVNYTTSTSFNNSEDGSSDIGFNIFVVSNVSADNAMSGIGNGKFFVVANTSYSYAFGKYNYEKSEFRGFGKATERDSDSETVHYFYQDNPRRGKEYQTEVYDSDGNIYSKNVKDYNYTYEYGIYNISLIYSTDYLYDGSADNPVVTNKSYFYDWFGNLWSMIDHGDVSIDGDEKYYEYSYAMNPTYWIMDRVSRKAVLDEDSVKVSEVKYYYDEQGLSGVSSEGALTKVERWNKDGDNSFSYYEYDDYGNVIEETDSLGNKVRYSYDTTYTYVDTVINPLGHITKFDYDLGTGNLNWQEKNDIRTEFEYDDFGRIEKEIRPYDTSNLPTRSYEYDFDGTAPEKVTISQKTTADNTIDVSYYYDGMANLVQIKSDIEDNQSIVKNIFYDFGFRVNQEQNPYFADTEDGLTNVSDTANYTQYSYDVMDRVIQVTNPDGTQKNVTFNHYNITDYDENGNKQMYTLDAHGRIVNVYEYNTNDVGRDETYITDYEYGANNNLIKIIDHEDNEFQFSYDSLGRKVGMNDPDLGEWSYSYDTNGNLKTQTDARGEVISLDYDSLGRVTTKTYDDNNTEFNITFSYDGDYYGTLTNLSRADAVYSFEYDDRLRVIEETKIINGSSLDSGFIYDSADRLVSKLRNGNNRDFIYNRQSRVKQIPDIITEAYYSPFGSILNKTYANSLSTSYSYDTENNRLQNIIVPGVQNLSYTYDSVGNILNINDQVQDLQHILSYDNLDRLVEATIGTDRYVYSFNALGNIMKIVKNNESKKFIYEGAQAHMPSKIIEGTAGIDVMSPTELDTGNKNRTIEFFLVNDKNDSLNGVNFSIEFGDSNSFSNESITVQDNVMVLIQHDYSNGGDYVVNISAQSPGTSDRQTESIKFGINAQSLDRIYSNISEAVFEFIVNNDLVETAENLIWNCSDGIDSLYSANLTGGQSLYDYIQHNYSTAGDKTFQCNVTSDDGTDSLTIEFTIQSLEIENYDILSEDISKRVISFDAVNYFTPAEVNISIDSDSGRLTNLSSNENIMAFVETNYSDDGTKSLSIAFSGAGSLVPYTDTFTLEGISIENYQRTAKNYTSQIYVFDVVNSWHSGNVNWSISDPGISNVTYLDTDDSIMVMIEHNYSGSGVKPVEVKAKRSSVQALFSDIFELRPIEIESFQTLSDGLNSVSELVVSNNINRMQQFSWLFGSGTENISSDSQINISSDDVFIFIASNYSDSGAYKTTAFINTTSAEDSQSGVTIA